MRQLLNNFALDEQQVNAYQPAKDLQANQQLLPPAAQEWDRQLAAAVRQLQAAVQPELSTAGDTADTAGHVEQQQQQELLLFKVSKATAAAMLSPAEAQEASQRLQRLQPLKWAHFALRQRYMAEQIKELCSAAAKAAGSQPAVAVHQRQAASADQAAQRGQPAAALAPAAAAASSATVHAPARKHPTVLVVVGRQHVHGLEAMWRDPGSSLWRDRMPRSFAASMVEQQGISSTETATQAGEDTHRSGSHSTPNGSS